MRPTTRTLELDSPVTRPTPSANRSARVLRGDGSNIAAAANHVPLSAMRDSKHVSTVRLRLAAIVDAEFPLLSRVCADHTDAAAAQIRMHLVFLAGEFGGTDVARSVTLAMAVELAHLAFTVDPARARSRRATSGAAPRGRCSARVVPMFTFRPEISRSCPPRPRHVSCPGLVRGAQCDVSSSSLSCSW